MSIAARCSIVKLTGLACVILALTGCPAATGPGRDTVLADAKPQCPQPRATQAAPATYQALNNPLDPTAENVAQGRALYAAERPGGSCAACHGLEGDGSGPLGRALVPPPRDFTCAATMDALSDGQLFWITAYGSGAFHQPAQQGAQQVPRPGRRENRTAMTAFRQQLSDAEIWQLVVYMRSFAGDATE